LATLSGSSSSTTPQSIGVDDTAVTGLTRIIRYTASEEEDMINETASSLPSGADGAITATAYIVKDLDTGTAVVEYNDERLQPIASLTKLVTAEIAREFIDPDMPITLTSEIMRTYGNTANFRVGETFSASDLMYPLLLVSSNDAAEAYAQSYGRAKFLKAMNDFTQRIGAFRTYFDDPSGLSPKNESTATDMAIILDWIRRNDPTIIDITQLKSKTIRNHTWVNPTHFLSWSYYLGGKNGYTDEADRTAASLFSLTPRKDTYAVVILGSSNRDADVIKLLKKVR
jgi:D-alanyl-D-alanine carboxypeptidase